MQVSPTVPEAAGEHSPELKRERTLEDEATCLQRREHWQETNLRANTLKRLESGEIKENDLYTMGITDVIRKNPDGVWHSGSLSLVVGAQPAHCRDLPGQLTLLEQGPLHSSASVQCPH